MIANTVGVSTLRFTSYLPDPLLVATAFAPWTGYGITLPIIHPSTDFLTYFGHLFVVNRLIINTVGTMMNFMFNHVGYPKRRFSADPQFVMDKYDKIGRDLVIGDGYPGIRELK